jgi:uracil-DNA glycosylase family 4
MARRKCNHCEKLLVEPYGPADSPILMAGEFPGYYEVTSGIPFHGPTGDVLKAELTRLSVDWRRIRLTNLWGHDATKEEEDLNWHLGRLIQEMEGRKAILLMGSDTAKVFFNKPVFDIAGLPQESDLVPESVEVLMATINPAFVTHKGSTVGEFRTDLGKFVRKARKFL